MGRRDRQCKRGAPIALRQLSTGIEERLLLNGSVGRSEPGNASGATGITVYLLNGGHLEYAQQMAAHESACTTKLYDRGNDQVTLDQVERIVL